MATTTTNLGLTKPAYADAADIAIINSNMDIIDSNIKSLQDTTATHTSQISSLQDSVNNMGLLYDGNNRFGGMTSQRGDFVIRLKDEDTGKYVMRLCITGAGNLRIDETSDDGATWTTTRYFQRSDAMFMIANMDSLQNTLASWRSQGFVVDWMSAVYRDRAGQSQNGYIINMPFGSNELVQLYLGDKSYWRGMSKGALTPWHEM